MLDVAARDTGFTPTDMMAAEALRIEAAHATALFHQRYDLAIAPTTPTGALPADAPTIDADRALHEAWAPWTFTANLTRQPAITVPVGLDADGMPRGVQVMAALCRDDLALRGAYAVEQAAGAAGPAPVAG